MMHVFSRKRASQPPLKPVPTPRRKGLLGWISTHLILICIIAIILFPAAWIFLSSFKHTFYGGLWPEKFMFDNYVQLLTKEPFLRWMANTMIICWFTVGLTLALTTTAAYAFSRLRFWGRNKILMGIILVQMFPALMGVVAIYKILSMLGGVTGGIIGLDSYWGLILIYAGGGVPFYTWLIKGYMDTIPRAVDEAALIDGATRFQIFTKIILPLCKPMLGVIAIMAFIAPYNDFVLPSIVITSSDKYPLAVGLQKFLETRYENYPLFAAGATLGAIPILIVFLAFQRYLIAGLTRGAAK